MKPRIKICGIRTIEEIDILNQLPIHYVGFIFAPSKRRVSIETAKKLINRLNDNIKTVGVFVNEESDEVNKTAHTLDLDVVQLHGDESKEYVLEIEKNVWKAYKVKKAFNIKRLIREKRITGNLFDGRNPGSGEVFNWTLIESIESEKTKILAGGLTPNNIQKAIRSVNPGIIDVSSGVEIDDKKNEILLKRLIRRIENV